MSGGWAGSDRRKRLPPNWSTLVAQVKRRSGGRCEWFSKSQGGRCTRTADGGVDHIDRDAGDGIENLRDLCRWHHGKKSSVEGNAAKAERRALRTRPTDETHPGRTA